VKLVLENGERFITILEDLKVLSRANSDDKLLMVVGLKNSFKSVAVTVMGSMTLKLLKQLMLVLLWDQDAQPPRMLVHLSFRVTTSSLQSELSCGVETFIIMLVDSCNSNSQSIFQLHFLSCLVSFSLQNLHLMQFNSFGSISSWIHLLPLLFPLNHQWKRSSNHHQPLMFQS